MCAFESTVIETIALLESLSCEYYVTWQEFYQRFLLCAMIEPSLLGESVGLPSKNTTWLCATVSSAGFIAPCGLRDGSIDMSVE